MTLMVERLGVRTNRESGFTIIELLLAMSFVAILLIAVVSLTINLSRIYSRGVTYKELNQVGSEISNDIRRVVSSAEVSNIKYVNTDTHNRLCLGGYSYVWNELSDSNAGSQATKYGTGATLTARLLKVVDPTGKYCTKVGTPTPTLPQNVDEVGANSVTELLKEGGNRELVVYKITVTPLQAPVSDISTATAEQLSAGRALYTIRLTLGTNEESQIEAGERCKAPKDGGDEYCAINVFTTVVSVGDNRGIRSS